MQRKGLAPNDFHNLGEVEGSPPAGLPGTLRADRHTVEFTQTNPDALLNRIAAHPNAHQVPAA
jgi:hypothetical protein